jgi:hypothetical protein
MKDYFAALGLKATGSASAIRSGQEPLYRSPRLAARPDLDRDFSGTATTYDDGLEFVFGAGLGERKPAAIAPRRTEMHVGESAHAAASQEQHVRGSSSASAVAVQIHELQQRLESDADASSSAAGGSAPHATQRQPEAWPAADDVRPIMTPVRGDPGAARTSVPLAERDGLQPLEFTNADKDGRPSVMERDLPTISADAIARRSGDAPADAAQPSHAKQTHVAESIAGDSPRDASVAAHRSNGADQLDSAVVSSTGGHAGRGAKSDAAVGAAPTIRADAGKPSPASKSEDGRVWHRPPEIASRFSAMRDERSGSRRPNVLPVAAADPEASFPLAAAHARETHLQTVEQPAGRTRANPDDTPAAVQVSIGRIEIREQRPAPAAPARRAQPPRMDLKEYLNRRFREGAP